jgi:acetoin utilization protein AcuB
MQVRDWMKKPAHFVKPLDSVQHARELMEKHRVNQLPVTVDGRLVGIVTDRDLRDASPSVFEAVPGRRRRLPADADPKSITIEGVMSPSVLTIGPADSVVEAARTMRRERIGSLPVVEGGKLVGMLTRSDLLDAFIAVAAGPT